MEHERKLSITYSLLVYEGHECLRLFLRGEQLLLVPLDMPGKGQPDWETAMGN